MDKMKGDTIFPVTQVISAVPSLSKHSWVKLNSRSEKGEYKCIYLVTFLNIASIFGYVPFKIDRNPETDLYQITPVHVIRKFICAAIGLLNAYTLMLYGTNIIMQDILYTTSSSWLARLLYAFTAFASLGQNFFLQKAMWTRKGQAKVLEIIEGCRLPFTRGFLGTKFMDLIAIFLFLCTYAICNYTYRDVYDNAYKLELRNVWMHVSCFHPMALSYFGYTLLSIVGLAILPVGKEFASILGSTNENNINEGLFYYAKIRHLSTSISQLFGTPILFLYLITVAFVAQIVDASALATTVQKVACFTFLSYGPIIWLAAAEFYVIVGQAVREWLSKLQSINSVSMEMRIRLVDTRNDYATEHIGISCKFFMISYSFIGSMFGLILTYAVIVFQMPGSKDKIS